MVEPVPDAGSTPFPATSCRPLTDGEFDQLRKLVYSASGIHLSEAKKALVASRLAKRIRELSLPSFGAYYRVVEGGGDELVRMLDAISTNETRFFREPRHFDYLRETLFPTFSREAAAGKRPKRIRIWSAGCSTGQEPYSLAMAFLDAFPSESGWTAEITATDLSTRVLGIARAGDWPVEKSAEIPERLRKAYMLRGIRSQEGRMKAGPEIRSLIRFDRLNLSEDHWAVQGPFDLILCRNVLIYFTSADRAKIVERFAALLPSGGHLFVGHAESLGGGTSGLRVVEPTVYAKPGGPS